MWTKTHSIILIGYLVSARLCSANVFTIRIIFRRDTKIQCQFTILLSFTLNNLSLRLMYPLWQNGKKCLIKYLGNTNKVFIKMNKMIQKSFTSQI